MSIKKVANIAGVSIATVSRYFNNPEKVSKKTQEKVQGAIDKINYSPNSLAQNLRRGKTGLIIAVVPKINASAYEPLTKQLHRLANEFGYSLLVKQSNYNSLTLDYFENMIRCKQADGFVVLTGLNQQEAGNTKASESMPIILACEPHMAPSDSILPYLAVDYYKASQEATEYLLSNRHECIGFIARNYASTSIQQQQAGYLNAMRNAGLEQKIRIIKQEDQALDLQQKLNIILKSNPRPTALCCADDDTAMELMHWIKLYGLTIPEDISIMGFNNTYFSKLCDPPLSTVHNPMDDIGAQAMDLLLRLIDNQNIDEDLKSFDHNIIIRSSTRALDKE